MEVGDRDKLKKKHLFDNNPELEQNISKDRSQVNLNASLPEQSK